MKPKPARLRKGVRAIPIRWGAATKFEQPVVVSPAKPSPSIRESWDKWYPKGSLTYDKNRKP